MSETSASLFATGIYGTVKVVATGIFLLIGIDRWGRKKSLIGGAAWMSTMMFIIGAVLATHPPNTKAKTVSHASIGMVVMIYLYVIGYSASWGPTPWVYLGEVCFRSTRFPRPLLTFSLDLPNPSSLLWCRSRCGHTMAVQLCHHRGHSPCYQ